MASANSSDCLKNLEELVHESPFKNLPQNKNIPIVLGFSGWGAPLLGSLNYWGGVQDIPNLLMQQGHTVIVSSIAPLSSNWERACELYKELTCGKFIAYNATDEEVQECYDLDIDYGHYFDRVPGQGPSDQGPERTTTTYRKRAILFTKDPKNYVEWKWSQEKQVHFICHSQGGTTVRLLIDLMANGDPRHPDYFGQRGRDDWAISVTTLGTPHRGTTICDVIPRLFSASEVVSDQAIALLGRLFATLTFKAPALQVFDLQLDHWGIGRRGNESFQTMRDRLECKDGPVRKWALSKHNAFYDNSIKGVSELSPSTKTPSPHIHYFTLSFHATVPFPTNYPDWGRQAAEKFPVSIVQFARAILHHIPFLGGLADSILSTLVGVGGWAIFSSSVTLRNLVIWGTAEVAQRLLNGIGYNITLPGPGKYLPRNDVIPLMLPTVYAMGGQALSEEQKQILAPSSRTDDWYLNDGIVNTASMKGPVGTEAFDISAFLKNSKSDPAAAPVAPAKGHYWHFGVTDKMDHADEIGVWIEEDTSRAMERMYKNLAELVSRLN